MSDAPEKGVGLYGIKPTRAASAVRFISSGSTLLDCVNGGGWPLGRMTNLIGDKSTGKTLLAIEAFANFNKQYPKGMMFYRESEAAFDQSYAKSIGMPTDRINFGKKGQQWRLVEDVYEDIKEKCAIVKDKGCKGFYVIDSMDALTTKIDMEREFGIATYRTDKPSQLGELFRKMTGAIEEAQMGLIVISQVRAKIGVTFGDKTTRSGGAALDFYASLINKLAHMKQLSVTRGGNKRVIAVRVRARNTKSKVGEAFRECEFTIRFGYGINDASSCMEWLIEQKRFKDVDEGLTKEKALKLLKYLEDLDPIALSEWTEQIQSTTKLVWEQVEDTFRPKVTKY